jgi:hypothetical protein
MNAQRSAVYRDALPSAIGPTQFKLRVQSQLKRPRCRYRLEMGVEPRDARARFPRDVLEPDRLVVDELADEMSLLRAPQGTNKMQKR